MHVASIRTLLQGLTGQTINTISGRPNTVLAVNDDSVRVGTARSPKGQKVVIQDIEAAYERLMRDGAIEINPQSVGYRSSFIGQFSRRFWASGSKLGQRGSAPPQMPSRYCSWDA